MPLRKTPLVNGQIYHVFNRSVAKQPIFNGIRECDVFLNLVEYYNFVNIPMRYSYLHRINIIERVSLYDKLYRENQKYTDINALSVMPNHYHLLIKQNQDGGISNYIRLLQNSYSHYLNVKTGRSGALFQSPFKAVRIENDEQFLHVARYIHLNPLTSYLIKKDSELMNCKYNSYRDYVTENPRRFITTKLLMSFFKNKEGFSKFHFDHVDYQRRLKEIEHLMID